MQILISAGEASGEMYGAQLIAALQRLDPSFTFFGVGGDRMRAAGCDTVVDAKDLAVVGITEILSHLPKIWGLYHQLIREADKRKPLVSVVIDSPAFNWRVARQMKRRGIPAVYYVAPQFWAWRQGRVRLLRDYIDKALVIFPFEEKFYRDRGVDATFVGHPLTELPHPTSDRGQYAAQFRLGLFSLLRGAADVNLVNTPKSQGLMGSKNAVGQALFLAQFDEKFPTHAIKEGVQDPERKIIGGIKGRGAESHHNISLLVFTGKCQGLRPKVVGPCRPFFSL